MAHKMETTTSNYVNDSIVDEDIVNTRSADSGYSSHGSLSHVSSINASSLRSSMSQHYLQPIYENIPVNSFLSTTELTPTSQSIQRINEFHITSPNSSLKRSASSLPCTPYKIETPKKRRIDGKVRSKTFRNMIDNIHVDENSENLDIGKFEISPIKAANVLQERNGKFERKGSFSSTPIYEDSLLKSMSVSKTDFFNTSNRAAQNSLVIRKTKSFSPSKKRCLVTRNRQVAVDSSPMPEDIESLFNPARKSIKRMLSRQNAIDTLPEPSTSNFIDMTATDIWDADINLASPVIEKSTPIETPVKRIRRNLSFNLAQQSPKKELDKIIFSKIPSSPIKQRIPATKRSSTAKDDVVAKRPLFDLSPLLTKRKSFAHLKHFDILSHLAETTTAIEMIFNYLGPKDIYNMYNVCQKWRTIVKNDAFAISQRNKCMSTMVKNKENLQRKPILKSRSLVAIPKSPLKRANSVNLRKNPLRKASTISIMDDPLVLIKENQRRTKCPVCLRPSIIAKSNNNERNRIIEKRIPFQRSIYCDNNLFQSMPNPTNFSQYEFAECTKCAFKFCMKCKCEFHGSDMCPVKAYIAPMDSEDEEDVKMLYPTGSRSKRNLRRLCSLDKVKFSSLG